MNYRYLILLFLLVAFIGAIIFSQKREPDLLNLKPEYEKITSSSEWINTEKAISGMEDLLRTNPEKYAGLKIKLAHAYIQKGRVTGENTYYDALAFKLVNDILNDDPENFEALCCKATLEASAHQFTNALQTSSRAIALNPYNAHAYGVKIDALVELGKYDEAIAAADKMVSIRPDIRSYSRISYLREIHGDYPGAIEAMKLALKAGYPGLEQTEWVRVYLGRLYEMTGKLQEAEMYYRQALLNRNFYGPALAGLARIEKANKNYDKAIELYKQAIEMKKDYSLHQELATLYRLTNKNEHAANEFQVAMDLLINHKHPTSEENGTGHNIDLELASVFSSMHEYEKALNCALAEYELRPDNIDVNGTLAWAYYNTNDYKKATRYILKSLRTKSKNAELWYKAGLIFKANNMADLGDNYCLLALRTNPSLDTAPLHTNEFNKNLTLR